MTRVLSVLLLAALLPAGLAPTGCGGRSGAGRSLIQNKGSDTLFDGAQALAEHYAKVDPSVVVAVNGGGSGTGIAALINGTVDIANASRKIKPEELAQARAHGADPQEFVVGYDAIAVYVHPSNPLQVITIPQLAEIYGDAGTAQAWKDLGVEVPGCEGGEIIVVGRQNSSGTFLYFREAVLGSRRDFRLGTRDMHGSKDVVELVGKTACAIGYSGVSYMTPAVKALPVAKQAGEAGVVPSIATVLDGTYPIARPLFMYTRVAPTGAVKAYLDWVLSDEGQRVLAHQGYAPVRHLPSPAEPAAR